MKSSIFTSSVVVWLAFSIVVSALAQSGRPTQNVPVQKEAPKKAQPSEAKPKELPANKEETPDPEAIKLDSTLVMVPVIASDRNGLYIADLKAAELTVYEDGEKQEVAYFATVKEPFHVVLIIDTSASSIDKMREIQRGAVAFVGQLQAADRVQVISFDSEVRVLTAFTSDRAKLQQAIEATRPGGESRVYDAFHQAMMSLTPVRRDRRAIVFFTDGVDRTSHSSRYDENLREVEESGVIVYPIRYDTRADVEALIRQQRGRGQIPDIGVILKSPPRGTTPPTTPGGGSPVPDDRTGGRLPTGLPLPPVIINRPRRDPNDQRYPNDPNDPRNRYPNDSNGRYPNDPGRSGGGRSDPMTDAMLDNLYRTADQYLNDLAVKSGGRLHRADTLISLPDAFAKIAAELRTQYALGYYPTNGKRDGSYRKIQVKTSRKNTVIRARPGYQAQGS